jgi:hypothetical protein
MVGRERGLLQVLARQKSPNQRYSCASPILVQRNLTLVQDWILRQYIGSASTSGEVEGCNLPSNPCSNV